MNGPDLVPKKDVLPAETHPIVDFTDADLAALMRRSIWITAVLGVLISIFIWLGMGWQNAVLFAMGAAISVAGLFEWGRLIRLINSSMDQQKTPRGAALVVTLFFLRLLLFGGAIYVTLRCFHGSPLLLAGGLALGIVGLTWEALKELRG